MKYFKKYSVIISTSIVKRLIYKDLLASRDYS